MSRLMTVVAGLSFVGCGDYAIALPGGYSLVRVNAAEILISDPTHTVVILPTVDEYGVFGDLVIGHASVPNLPPDPAPPRGHEARTRAGYFVLNTRTRDVKDGLERRAWLVLLNGLGVSGEPKLKRPSRFDRYFRPASGSADIAARSGDL